MNDAHSVAGDVPTEVEETEVIAITPPAVEETVVGNVILLVIISPLPIREGLRAFLEGLLLIGFIFTV